MGSLYIGGGQCKYAQLHDYDDWREFDNLRSEIQALGNQFGVFVNRYDMEELSDGINFVISHQKIQHECFFSGGAFEYNMHIEVSNTFNERAEQFIKALEADEKFKAFHGLSWSAPKVIYFAVS